MPAPRDDDEELEGTWPKDWAELEPTASAATAKVLPAPKPTETDWVKKLTEDNQRAAEEGRIRGLRRHGENHIPLLASAIARSAVIEALARYVTTDRFPSSMSSWEAHRAIEAKVAAILEPFADADRRRKDLIEHGRTRAERETADWDWEPRDEALAEVAAVLADEVEADMTRREVDDRVDEILDEWPDDEDEDEDE